MGLPISKGIHEAEFGIRFKTERKETKLGKNSETKDNNGNEPREKIAGT